MNQSSTWMKVLPVAIVSALLMAAGCAATGPTNQSTTAASSPPADETPTSTRNLIDAADLTTEAEGEGFRVEVRDGDVLYCRKQVDFSERTRIPTRQCVDKDELRLLLEREQQQRDAASRMRSSPVCPAGGC